MLPKVATFRFWVILVTVGGLPSGVGSRSQRSPLLLSLKLESTSIVSCFCRPMRSRLKPARSLQLETIVRPSDSAVDWMLTGGLRVVGGFRYDLSSQPPV